MLYHLLGRFISVGYIIYTNTNFDYFKVERTFFKYSIFIFRRATVGPLLRSHIMIKSWGDISLYVARIRKMRNEWLSFRWNDNNKM